MHSAHSAFIRRGSGDILSLVGLVGIPVPVVCQQYRVTAKEDDDKDRLAYETVRRYVRQREEYPYNDRSC